MRAHVTATCRCGDSLEAHAPDMKGALGLLTQWNAEHAHHNKKGRWWIDVALLWVAIFGVWPFMDPGHALDSMASVVDVAIHWVALIWLALRWRLEVTRR